MPTSEYHVQKKIAEAAVEARRAELEARRHPCIKRPAEGTYYETCPHRIIDPCDECRARWVALKQRDNDRRRMRYWADKAIAGTERGAREDAP